MQSAGDWAAADQIADRKADEIARLERVRRLMARKADEREGPSLAARDVKKLDEQIKAATGALADACELEGRREQEMRALARRELASRIERGEPSVIVESDLDPAVVS